MKVYYIVIGIAMLLILSLSACTSSQDERTDTTNQTIKQDIADPQEVAKRIATEYIKQSPTYQYDGYFLKYIDTGYLKCEHCYVFKFEFTSSHSGYGDRQAMIVSNTITQHTVFITVQENEVTKAIMDDVYNMITKEMIEANTIDTSITKTFCDNPRPLNCYAQVDPVCASDTESYSNGCIACQNPNVQWYTSGLC